MEIGFVFTNFNNADFTINAINSLKENIDNYSIVVVDNFSDDNDKEKLKSIENEIKNVKIIFNDKNVGYFKGLNIGINYLQQFEPQIKCMVVGNNDVLFPNDFYQSILINNNLFSKYPVISPDIVTTDGFHQNPHVIKKISKIREFIYDLYHSSYVIAKLIIILAKITKKYSSRGDEKHYQIAQEIYQGYGACYILTPLFFEKFKQLDSPTFLMYEEYFLSLQLQNKGFKVYYEPSISIKHLMHATTNKLPGKLKWKFSRDSHKLHRKTNKIF